MVNPTIQDKADFRSHPTFLTIIANYLKILVNNNPAVSTNIKRSNFWNIASGKIYIGKFSFRIPLTKGRQSITFNHITSLSNEFTKRCKTTFSPCAKTKNARIVALISRFFAWDNQ